MNFIGGCSTVGAMTITVMWWESLFLGLVPFQLLIDPIFGGKVLKVPLGIFRGGTTNYVPLRSKMLI